MLRDALPIYTEPIPEESGMGYCLRSVVRNGLNLHWLRAACGLSYTRIPQASDAERLSTVLGCEPNWLSRALAAKSKVQGETAWLIYGQALLSRNHLRVGEPQVCTACLHERGWCHWSWDFSLIPVCPFHGIGLVDRCPRCGQRLRWDRPAVDVCNCGWALSGGTEAEAVEIIWARALSELVDAQRCVRTPMPDTFKSGDVLPLLRHVTSDGAFALLHAFGEAESEYPVALPSVTKKARAAGEWRNVLRRGARRLEAIQVGRGAAGSSLCVSHSLLRRLLTRHLQSSDHLLAFSLATAVFGESEARRMSIDSQLALFKEQI